MDLEDPGFVLGQEDVVDFLDLRRDVPSLNAQSFARGIAVPLAGARVGNGIERGPAGRRDDAAASRGTEQLPRGAVAGPRTVH